jgi:hypothetical protein
LPLISSWVDTVLAWWISIRETRVPWRTSNFSLLAHISAFMSLTLASVLSCKAFAYSTQASILPQFDWIRPIQSNWPGQSNPTSDTNCHVINCDYRRGLGWWTGWLNCLTYNSWLRFIKHYYTYTHTLVFTSRCSVAASNGEHSPSSGFRTIQGLRHIRNVYETFPRKSDAPVVIYCT